METSINHTLKRSFFVQLSDENDQQVVEKSLKKFDITILRDVKQFEKSVDIFVVDIEMFMKNKKRLTQFKEESPARLVPLLLICPIEKVDLLDKYKGVVDDVIIKPIHPTVLTLRMNTLLEKVKLSKLILTKRQETVDDFEGEWKDMVEQSPDLVQISIDGKIKYINPAGAKIYGASSAKELIGEFVRHPNDEMSVEELNNRIETAQKGEALAPRVLDIMAQTGERKFIKANSTPFIYNGKKAVHTVGQDITELLNMQKELKRIISQKQALLQEVHHRVKNNLAIINGLIELQLDKMLSEESFSVLKATQSRILSISKVHELLYQQENLNEIDTKTYLTHLTDMINKSFSGRGGEIQFDLEIESFYLSLDQAIPCGLLLNELISNSLKHGFSAKSEKRIALTVNSVDDEVSIHYRDYGKGLDQDFNMDRESNFGLLIIRTLLSQLQADWVQKSKDGFHLTYTFRKNAYNGPIQNVRP